MNREINTVGSKADGIGISELIITAKAELETHARTGPECRVARRPRAARGLLFIVSAPSGTGQDHAGRTAGALRAHLRMSRSYTSRPARPGEQDGVDYNFITRERFESMTARGGLPRVGRRVRQLLWHVRRRYRGDAGARRGRRPRHRRPGRPAGRSRGIETIGIFVLPPSAGVLEQRLRGRSKDSEEQIRRAAPLAVSEVARICAIRTTSW